MPPPLPRYSSATTEHRGGVGSHAEKTNVRRAHEGEHRGPVTLGAEAAGGRAYRGNVSSWRGRRAWEWVGSFAAAGSPSQEAAVGDPAGPHRSCHRREAADVRVGSGAPRWRPAAPNHKRSGTYSRATTTPAGGVLQPTRSVSYWTGENPEAPARTGRRTADYVWRSASTSA